MFDPDYGVVQKLRRQLALRIPDFKQQRVIRVSGDCASTLPDFLDGKLMETTDRSKKSRVDKKRVKKAVEAG